MTTITIARSNPETPAITFTAKSLIAKRFCTIQKLYNGAGVLSIALFFRKIFKNVLPVRLEIIVLCKIDAFMHKPLEISKLLIYN